MTTHRVMLRERGNKEPIYFECMADDADHAVEQALDMYPGAFIIDLDAAVRARVATRLEELRAELRSESMSYGELAELQSLSEYIAEGDVELLEAAGVPEFADAD
jgi:hypothetical protein